MLRVGSWINSAKAVDPDERFDLHVVSSEPGHIKPGATVLRNFGLEACYRGVYWEPDRSWCEYVDSVDGWLRDESGRLVQTTSGKSVWDHKVVDGGRIAQIMFKSLRETPWCHGVMLEMLSRRCIMPQWVVGRGWGGASVHWDRFFDEVMAVIKVRNRSKKWIITLNGRHGAFVRPDDLEYATFNKLEGAMVRPEFPDLVDSHDMSGGAYITRWDYWIERMQAHPSILEGFAQPEWGSDVVDQYTRFHAALCTMFDAICIRHMDAPGHWERMNEWHPVYDTLQALGEPTMPARRKNEVWWREFQGGRLMLNPARYAVQVAGVTVPAMDFVT